MSFLSYNSLFNAKKALRTILDVLRAFLVWSSHKLKQLFCRTGIEVLQNNREIWLKYALRKRKKQLKCTQGEARWISVAFFECYISLSSDDYLVTEKLCTLIWNFSSKKIGKILGQKLEQKLTKKVANFAVKNSTKKYTNTYEQKIKKSLRRGRGLKGWNPLETGFLNPVFSFLDTI